MSHALTSHAATAGDRPASLRHAVISGALAGQIAGLVMAVVVMAVFTLFLGKGPLYPVQVIGSLVFGDAALDGIHVGAIAAGLLLHQLGPALVWGIIFGLVVNRLDLRGAGLAVAAVATGVASQLIDVGVLVPAAMKALHGHDIWAAEVPAFWSWAAHLVFGIALLSLPWVSRRIARSA
ncbi:MAG TPA: hypothetical protein VK698_29080 [Kofleriaceae bacterium]|nr:hypothetical protein [Kofleriaceae bacterium]